MANAELKKKKKSVENLKSKPGDLNYILQNSVDSIRRGRLERWMDGGQRLTVLIPLWWPGFPSAQQVP